MSKIKFGIAIFFIIATIVLATMVWCGMTVTKVEVIAYLIAFGLGIGYYLYTDYDR